MGLYDLLLPLFPYFHFEPKEIGIVMPHINNLRFLLRDFQFQPFNEPLRYRNLGFLGVCLCPAKDTEIVCVPHNEHFF